MRSRILLLVVLAYACRALMGCVKAPIQMTTENHLLLNNSPFYSVHSPLPKLYYASRGKQTTAFAGGFLFGLLFLPVVFAMESSHDDLVALYHLENPSLTSEQALTQHIAKEYDLKEIRQNEGTGTWDDPEDLKRRFSQGLLLEVHNDRWELEPSSWSQFHMVLNTRARLVSVQDAKEIWYDACSTKKLDGERDLKMSDLKAKDGELLKSMLKACY